MRFLIFNTETSLTMTKDLVSNINDTLYCSQQVSKVILNYDF